jgi:hypothetical protein
VLLGRVSSAFAAVVAGLVAAAMSGCGNGALQNSQAPPARAARQATRASADTAGLSPLEKRLEAHGFVRVSETTALWLYGNKDIALGELLAVLDLKSAADFRPVVSSPPDEWLLQAKMPDNVHCFIEAPKAISGGPEVPPEWTHFSAYVARYRPETRTVISRGMRSEDWYPILEAAGAAQLSSTSSRVEGEGEMGSDNRVAYLYRLPDGTWARLQLKAILKNWELLAISVGPKGKSYKNESEWAEDVKRGVMQEVNELDLAKYAAGAAK